MPHLYPLSNDEFMQLHREAWENGWTYGPGFDELYLDYLVNWVYFVDYLDLLINACVDNRPRQYERSSSDEVTLCFDDGQERHIQVPDHYRKFFNKESIQVGPLNILIGEAPPFWAGTNKLEDRTYFYNPNHICPMQTWLTVPYNYFVLTRASYTKIRDKQDKIERLTKLSKKGAFLIDVFPFPIQQDTKVRNAVSDGFSKHIQKYFIPHFEAVMKYIKPSKKNAIKIGFMAPEYTSLQLMYGKNTSVFIRKSLVCWKGRPLNNTEKISNTIFKAGRNRGILTKASDKAKFLYRIINDTDWDKSNVISIQENYLEDIPIFISEGGLPNFFNYCNLNQTSLVRMLRQ